MDWDKAMGEATDDIKVFVQSNGFKDLKKMAQHYHYTDKPFAFVGGFFYRRILEKLHGYPFAADHCDIDVMFFYPGRPCPPKAPAPVPIAKVTTAALLNQLMAEPITPWGGTITAAPPVVSNYPKKGLKIKKLKEKENEFYGSLHTALPEGRKLDIIYAGDMMDVEALHDKDELKYIQNCVNEYWAQVPLTIQQVAIVYFPRGGSMKMAVSAAARDSMMYCDLVVNNQKTLDDYCEFKGLDSKKYLATKRKSLRFGKVATV